MNNDCPRGALIPFYVNGTLEPAEQVEIEKHLPACPECSKLLETATELSEAWKTVRSSARPEHVHSQLLTEFALGEPGLTDDAVVWIRSHVAGCDVCKEAVEVIQDLEHRSKEDVVRSQRGSRRWSDFLSATILRPQLAGVYLLTLLVVLGLYLAPIVTGPPGHGSGVQEHPTPRIEHLPPPSTTLPLDPAAVVPKIFRLEDVRFRGAGRPETAVLRVGPEKVLLLRLVLDLDPWARKPGSLYEVRVAEGSRRIWDGSCSFEGLDADSVPLVLSRSQLSTNREYTIRVVYVAPEETYRERVLLERSFKIEEP